MKKLILCALVASVYALPLSAAETDTGHLIFSEDATNYTVAANDEQRKNAIQRNFTSRRAYKNRSVQNKNQYDENEAWVGATQKIGEERKLEQVKRLNRRFISRRAYRH